MEGRDPSAQDHSLRQFLERLPTLATFLLPILLVTAFALRASLVESMAGGYTDCRGCYLVPTLGNDAWLLTGALVLLALGWGTRWPPLGLLARVLVGLLIVLACVDVALLDLLSQRLHFDDVVRLGSAISNNWSVVRASFASPAGVLKAVIGVIVLVVIVISWLDSHRRPRVAATCVAAALAASGFALYARTLPLRYVHSGYAENVIAINLPQGRIKPYSQSYVEAARATVAAMPKVCEQREAAQRPDVIILLVESLSAWHSRLLGSMLDWTPRLDAIARDNHYFTRFYANGFTTSGGEIAIATGRVPFNPPGVLDFNFDNYALPQTSLPTLVRRAGYRSYFFTPGDTTFLSIGDWLRDLGFDGVDGSDSPFYADQRRGQFNAVEDRAFYARYLHWFDQQAGDAPFVSLLLTVTTHPPFVDPQTGRIDPQAAFRYVDEQIGDFHDALRARGFFEHGVLVVLGDHRSMTPLRADEFNALGERAFAQVPMVVVGAVDMPKVVTSTFQQSDLLSSLAWLLGERSCRDAFAGSFLRPDPQPPRYALHVRGDDRNRIDVYHGEHEVSGFRLAGDDSEWLDRAPADGEEIAAWIAVQRTEAVERRLQKERAARRN